eukprot:TRINITY_DN15900_c0_g1_i1.p1 TRINITY_DN15900_c0_g1~~TRINITY_DN15900_c0_g1_i1.p1  ORF type:complete len:511 (+),score=47.32 TRINITY_DN15900_c0_g1_i1:82-1614(+)
MSSVCPSCNKRVYFAERTKGFDGRDWHPSCAIKYKTTQILTQHPVVQPLQRVQNLVQVPSTPPEVGPQLIVQNLIAPPKIAPPKKFTEIRLNSIGSRVLAETVPNRIPLRETVVSNSPVTFDNVKSMYQRLPPEMWDHLFLFLGPRTIGVLRSTCRFWKDACFRHWTTILTPNLYIHNPEFLSKIVNLRNLRLMNINNAEMIRQMDHLRHLHICILNGFSSRDVRSLNTLCLRSLHLEVTNLWSLYIPSSPRKLILDVKDGDSITKAVLNNIKQQKKLRSFGIRTRKLRNVLIPSLEPLINLRFLELQDPDPHFEFWRLTNLRKLRLDFHSVYDYQIDQISELLDLRDLSFRTCPIVILIGLEFIIPLTKLRNLQISDPLKFLSDDGLQSLTKLPNLRTLEISDSAVTYSGITTLTQLRELRLGIPKLDRNLFIHLWTMKDLQALMIKKCFISGDDFSYLTKLKNLSVLMISACGYMTKNRAFKKFKSQLKSVYIKCSRKEFVLTGSVYL